MPFKTKCPGCAKILDVPDSVVGKRVKCPACAQLWQVPAPTAQTPAAAAPAKRPHSARKCPGCGKAIQVPDSMAGKRVKCPACAHVWQIPGKVVDGQAALGTPGGGLTPGCRGGEEERVVRRHDGRRLPDRGRAEARCRNSLWRPFFRRGGTAAPLAEEEKTEKLLVERRRESDSARWLLCIFCGNIACIVGIVYLCLGKPKGTKIIVASICFTIVWFIVGFVFGFMQALLQHQQHGFH